MLGINTSFIKKDFIILQRGREGEREGEKHPPAASRACSGQTRSPGACRVGTEPATLRFTGWRPTNGATPGRAG